MCSNYTWPERVDKAFVLRAINDTFTDASNESTAGSDDYATGFKDALVFFAEEMSKKVIGT